MKAKDGQNQQYDAQWRTKEGSEAGSMGLEVAHHVQGLGFSSQHQQEEKGKRVEENSCGFWWSVPSADGTGTHHCQNQSS